MDFVSSTSGVKPLNGLVTWKGDSLSSGEIKTLTYVARVAGDRIDGEVLNNSVAVTAQNNFDEEVKAENSSKIYFVKGQEMPLNETKYTVQSVPGSEKIVESEKTVVESTHGINLTLRTDPVATSVMTNEEVYFDIILKQIGNIELKNVSLEVELDPGMKFLSPKGLNVSNSTIRWPIIESISGELKKSFVAKVKDTNFYKTTLYVSARVKSNEPYFDESKTLGLKYKKVQTAEETEHSIIARQIDEGVPTRKILTRPSYQLGKRLIWDRYAYIGWKQPRPQQIEYFIVNETKENASGKSGPLLIGSVGKKN
jgi:hypothetical protein